MSYIKFSSVVCFTVSRHIIYFISGVRKPRVNRCHRYEAYARVCIYVWTSNVTHGDINNRQPFTYVGCLMTDPTIIITSLRRRLVARDPGLTVVRLMFTRFKRENTLLMNMTSTNGHLFIIEPIHSDNAIIYSYRVIGFREQRLNSAALNNFSKSTTIMYLRVLSRFI